MRAKKGTGMFKKVVRFLFKDLWESTYRRKKERALYRYQAFGRWPVERIYYPRYWWIRKKKKKNQML